MSLHLPRNRLLFLGATEINRLCPAITPVLGAELLTNGNMETGDPPSSWTAGASATLDGVADERTGGAGAQALSIVNGGAAYGRATQSLGNAAGDWISLTGWHRKVTANGGISIYDAAITALVTSVLNNTTNWASAAFTCRVPTANSVVLLGATNNTLGNESRYDDMAASALSFSSTLSLLGSISRKYGTWQCPPTIPTANTQGGMVLAYASATNYLLAYVNRVDGKAYLDKCISGTITNVVNGAVTYGAAKVLKVIGTVAGNFSLYYDGTQVGATTAVATATLGYQVGGFGTSSDVAPGLIQTSPAVT